MRYTARFVIVLFLFNFISCKKGPLTIEELILPKNLK